MNNRYRILLFSLGSVVALLFAFLAGGYFYRTGILSDIKGFLLQPSPQPTEQKPELQPDFVLEFLDDPQAAAMNSRPLPDNKNHLKFLVAGHVYGKPGDEEFHPAPTLLTNIALLRNIDPDFVVFLGDTVWRPSQENFDLLQELILDQFDVPIFNAVGNHDVIKRDNYQSRYGKTIYAFRYKDQLFFILDTTLKYYDLTEDQYSFLTKTIQEQFPGLKAIHIFMHHLLFLEENEVTGKQLLKPNEGDGRSQDFWDFLQSEIIPVSRSLPVYIYAGDVGAFQGSNLSPFYKKLPDNDVYFLATGLGNNASDSILIVDSSGEGPLNIQPFSLTGLEMDAIENYSFQEWSKK
jgi:hypothetical protein